MTNTIACPEAGLWRAWLDEQLGESTVDGPLARHLPDCADCRTTVDSLTRTSAAIRPTLDALAPSTLPSAAEVALARRRLAVERQETPAPVAVRTDASREQPRPIHPLIRAGYRWRVALGGLAAALALTLGISFTPEGQVLASQFLAQFRSQHFTVISFDPNQARAPFGGLSDLGTVSGYNPSQATTQVASVAEAAQRTGLSVKQPDASTLPAGLSATPRVYAMSGGQIRFTLDRAKVLAYLQKAGHPEVQVPAKLDKASLVVNIPPAVVTVYGSATAPSAPQAPATGEPAPGRRVMDTNGLVVGSAGEVAVGVEGNATLDELRSFLLSLPGLPPDAVTQLKAVQDWQNTLPIPVPVDQVNWQPTKVGGADGLILADNSGIGSGIVWHSSGQVFGVAGAFKAADVQRVANSLH